MLVQLTRPAGRIGVLTRPEGKQAVVEQVVRRGSLVRPDPRIGVLTRPEGKVGVFTPDQLPPDFPVGAIRVGDLGSWRPRVRGVLGEGAPPLAWSLLGFAAFHPSGRAADFQVALSATLDRTEPAHYVPGALRPQDAQGFTKDTIRVTDSLGVHRDLFAWWHADYAPEDQALSVAIGTDGVAGLYSGGRLVLTATGGTGPYVWDITVNRSGATLTAGGEYVAGPAVGIDRLRVTDSLGAVGYVQAEVLAGQLGADLTGDQEEEAYRYNVYGFACQPYAHVWGENGTGPYTVELLDNQTGATIEPAREMAPGERSTRVRLRVRDAAGAPVNLLRWNVTARAMRADGIDVGAVAILFASAEELEVVLPHPGVLELWASHLVLVVTMTPADGGEGMVIEGLFESPSESAYAAAQ